MTKSTEIVLHLVDVKVELWFELGWHEITVRKLHTVHEIHTIAMLQSITSKLVEQVFMNTVGNESIV